MAIYFFFVFFIYDKLDLLASNKKIKKLDIIQQYFPNFKTNMTRSLQHQMRKTILRKHH